MRAILIVLDSVGVGAAPDAAKYGDSGTNTLGHIIERAADLNIPWLRSLGLDAVLAESIPAPAAPAACCGRMREMSPGKDTVTGHWELAGVVLSTPFAVFETFPSELVAEIEKSTGVEFIGNYASSGTTILEKLGEQHIKTGRPILYTSADSVMQIAAHESVIPVKRLHEICRIARRCVDAHGIGRVIARPFIGEPGNFQRTANRHDFATVPPRTALNAIAEHGHEVHGVGKINDIFAGSGITKSHRTKSNAEGMLAIEKLWEQLGTGLIFANLVDFDTLYGHRRDVPGYAAALEAFDAWLGSFLPAIEQDDLLIITADHGNDPTHSGTDHTREEVPLLVKFENRTGTLGTRETFADVAATLDAFFELNEDWLPGTSLLKFAHRHAHPDPD